MDILITESKGFSPSALDCLQRGGFETHLYDGALAGVGEVIENYDGLIVRLGIHWSHELLARAKKLKFIATPTTGLNHIDLNAAAAQNVEVLSLRGLPGMERVTSTPEHALALLLALIRNVVPAVESTRRGEWDRDAFTGSMLSEKVIGIIGMGRTGRQMARYAEALLMKVVYFDPYVDEGAYTRCASLEELATASDVISLHVILQADTYGMLGADFFNNCRRQPLFINTARGELVDEKALLQALTAGIDPLLKRWLAVWWYATIGSKMLRW